MKIQEVRHAAMHIAMLLPPGRQEAAEVLREVNLLLGWQHGESMGEIKPFPKCAPVPLKGRSVSAAAAISAAILAFTIGWLAESPIGWTQIDACAATLRSGQYYGP